MKKILPPLYLIFFIIIVPCILYAQAPSITSTTPSYGYNNQTQGVVIKGNNFAPNTQVFLLCGGPSVISRLTLDEIGYPSYIYSTNRFAFSGRDVILTYEDGVLKLDVSNLHSPQETANLEINDLYPNGIALSGSYAYITSYNISGGREGLWIIDIETMQVVKQLTQEYPQNYYLDDIVISESLLLTIDYYSNEIHIFDISNPINPYVISHFKSSHCTEPRITSMSVIGNYLYVFYDNMDDHNHNGFEIIDITDPHSPQSVYYRDMGNVTNNKLAGVKGTYAYVVIPSMSVPKVEVWNIAQKATPKVVSTIDYLYEVYGISGRYLFGGFINDNVGKLARVFDITDPYNPRKVGEFVYEKLTCFLDFIGGYAFATSLNEFSIYNMKNPVSNKSIASVPLNGWAMDVEVKGDYAYVANYSKGLSVVDVREPRRPLHLNNFEFDFDTIRLTVSGNYAYLIDDVAECRPITVIDISNPWDMKKAGEFPCWGRAICVKGQYAYISHDDSKFSVVDISNPPNYKMINSVPINLGENLEIYNGYAYVASYYQDLTIVDINNPSQPAIVKYVESPGLSSYDVCIDENHVFVVGPTDYVQNDYLQVVDISDPQNATAIASFSNVVNSSVWEIIYKDKIIYAADSGGVKVIDAAAPQNIHVIDALPTIGRAEGIFVDDNNYIYVAADEAGLEILRSFIPCQQVTYIDSNSLQAIIPFGLQEGVYDIIVINPDHQRATLKKAYEAMISSQILNTIYVNAQAMPGGDGSSWAKAFRSIQDAIDIARLYEAEVWVAQGEYQENVILDQGIALYGGFGGTETQREQRNPYEKNTIINGLNRGCTIRGANNTIVNGFTIKGGKFPKGGGIYCKGIYAMIITNNIFTENSAEYGGALYCESSCLQIEDNQFINNSASHSGGAIAVDASSHPVIYNNSFKNNNAKWGAAIAYDNKCTIDTNRFEDNTAEISGGGIYVNETYELSQIVNNLFQGNQAQYGGGIYSDNSDVAMDENQFIDNTASESGGGIYSVYIHAADTSITNNTFTNNKAKWGAAIRFTKYCIIDNNTIENNIAELSGGGIYAKDAFTDSGITNNTIQYNTAEINGGGIAIGDSSSSNVMNNILRNNQACWGGGIYCENSSPNIENNIIIQNIAHMKGGGIFSDDSSQPVLIDNTMTNNTDENLDYFLAEAVTCKDVNQEEQPGYIDKTDQFFIANDERVYVWLRLRYIFVPVRIKWEWHSSDETLISTYTTDWIEDPKVSDKEYHFSWRFWDWINLDGIIPDNNYYCDIFVDEGNGFKSVTTLTFSILPGEPEDVNHDGIVNIYDLIKVAKKVGLKLNDPNYDPECNINNDDNINIFDLIAVARKII